jgi:CRP-like cAMP-binding protein
MSLDNDINNLSQVSFFGCLDVDQLRLLAFGSEHKALFAGSKLFSRDDQSHCGYVIVSGLIDLTITYDGVEKIVASVGAGGLVGELALITENQRVTDAVARRDTRLLCIPRALFMRMLEKYPQTAFELHKNLSRSVRDTIVQLDQVRQSLAGQEFGKQQTKSMNGKS